jgi:hypothetical protein
MKVWIVGGLFAVLTPLQVLKAQATWDAELIFDDGFQPPVLTVNNVLSWCSVSEDGGSPSTAATISTSYPHGTVVALYAQPASVIYVWGYWAGTDAAIINGSNDTSQNTAVTMSIDRTVTACCPFSGQTSCP